MADLSTEPRWYTTGYTKPLRKTANWLLEEKSIEEQILIALEAGTDVLFGINDNKQLLELVQSGKLSESRLDLSVERRLREQFELGLLENPFVDPNRAAYLLGNPAHQ